MTKSLMALTAEAMTIEQILFQNGGEITPELEAEIERITTDVATKADGYAIVMDRLEMTAERLKARADEFTKAAKACTNLQEGMKERLKIAVEASPSQTIDGDIYTWKLIKLAPAVDIDENVLGKNWCTVTTKYTPDKKRIKEAFESGIQVEGAWLRDVRALRRFIRKEK